MRECPSNCVSGQGPMGPPPLGATEVVQSHRRQLLESMQRFTHIKGDPTDSLAVLLMCDAELFRLEAAVRWLDSVDGRLRSGARLAQPDSVRRSPLDDVHLAAKTEVES